MSEISQRPGNLTLSGNLTVNGTTTTVNSTAINVNNQIVFEGATANESETTLTVVDPTADRTITFPDASGTVAFIDSPTFTGTVTLPSGQALIAPALGTPTSGVMTNVTGIVNTGIDASAAIALSKLATGALPTAITVASANIVDDSIVNADINSAADIVDTKLATISTALKVSNSATTATSVNTVSAIVARDASGNFVAGTITAALTGTASGNLVSGGALGTPSSGVADNMTTNTETAGNNTNQIASTAFVTAAVAAGVVTASADAILEALIDAKGDLIVGVANDTPARLAVGINGYFLKADTAAENGLAWAAIPTVSILDDVGDVTLTAIANGEFLKWNGTVWINSAVDLSVKANIASPTFTGVPAADTAAEGTNTTQLATTAFTIANRISPADNMFLSMVFR